MATPTSTPIAAGKVAGILPPPRRVPLDAPWAWLAAGWRDMWAIPWVSLTYGAVFAGFAGIAAAGLWYIGAASLMPALVGGMLLTGPFVAVGLYEASRRLSKGEFPGLGDVFLAAVRAPGQLAMFGSVLLFAFMIWLQLALLLMMLFLGDGSLPAPEAFMHTLLFTPRGLLLLIVGTLVGAVIATLVFSASAVAVALLLDKPVDAVTAARASIDAVMLNPKPMALWAALIVCMSAAGFATLMFGFVLAFPLIGHATWHAYADIYGDR
jgi:uncharacterized membrane protein